ncbi:unnamed protein product [Linum tenue]|uniref:Bromo domain-containing protein n=1 Tax=Linum tenue TaxID=586396 RepID=A0AAV0JBL5_9ROSI|nr:unnamed protein product [Linum tenue]
MGAVVMAAAAAAAGWGTWEELLLGGAVLRHGTRDWDAVAAELRTRFACTPEVCRTKYEDLQQRYSGCKAWFDELRKQRMAELRRALEVSEGSIGSLESKIETLKAEKIKDDSSSPAPSVKSEGIVEESLSKETSKDGLSAGSFTQETRSNWSLEPRLEPKPEPSTSPDNGKVLEEDRPLGFLKGRRGKRKRKVCGQDGKETSIEESADALGSSSMSAQLKDNSTSTCGEAVARVSGGDYQCRGGGSSNEGEASVDDLVGIFDTIAENKCATVFRRRLDSQKRGRYKKMILQHVDVDTIRGKISKGTLLSAKELFRDLLLLANNALVFYSRTTREYKSANLLRDIVTKSLKAYISSRTVSTAAAPVSITLPPAVLDPPPPTKKPPNARLDNKKAPSKVSKASPTTAKPTTVAAKKPAVKSGCKTPTKESKGTQTTAKATTTTVTATKPAGNLGCKTPAKESKANQTTAKATAAAAKKPAGNLGGQQSTEDESGKRKGGPGRQKKRGRAAEQQPEGGQSKGGRKKARVK